MELTGDIVIGAPRARVWAALNDPDVLAACIPGCEAVEVIGPLEKTARVMVKVGPVRARFAGRIVLADVVETERCAMSFEGSGGAAGMARGQSQVELSDEPSAEGMHTRLRYTVQASVAGKLGQVGGRMIDAAAKQMADQFFTAFQARVAPPAANAAPDTTTGATADAPATAPPSESAVVTAPRSVTSASSSAASALGGNSTDTSTDEWLRVRWFVLGALASAFGIWVGSRL